MARLHYSLRLQVSHVVLCYSNHSLCYRLYSRITMATLKMLDNMLNNPARQSTSPPSHTTVSRPTPSSALHWSLQRVITAVARYHRAGPTFKSKSEAFWVFAAASCTRAQYDEDIKRTLEDLPTAKSVEEDLSAAKSLVLEAISELKKTDIRDAKDLEEAWRVFEMVDGGW